MISNGYIVMREVLSLLRGETKYKSTTLKLLSLFSIISGFLHPLFFGLFFLDGACYFVGKLSLCIGWLQSIFIGLYQLNRLHHLFSNDKVNGEMDGYPNSLFIVMTVIAIVDMLVVISVEVLNAIPTRCGWNIDRNFHFVFKGISLINDRDLAVCVCIVTLIYICWDLTTLLLFIHKIQCLTESNCKSTPRTCTVRTASSDFYTLNILREMNRVVILTIFYIVPTFMRALWWFIRNFNAFNQWTMAYLFFNATLDLLSSTAITYAAYLMQPHNKQQYGYFLKVLTALKVHICCKCCRVVVEEQANHFCVDLRGNELQKVLLSRSGDDCSMGSTTAFNEFDMDDPPS